MSNHQHVDEPLVPVGTAAGEIEATMWQDALIEAGIRAMVKNTGPAAGYIPTFADEFIVYVLESQAERARQVLEEFASDDDDEGEPDLD